MDNVQAALATVNGLDSLTMRGQRLHGDILSRLTDANVVLPIDGAPTLSLSVNDPKRKLLKSGLLATRTVVNVDGYGFELVQVNKAGNDLTLTLEHEVVAALRRHVKPIKVKAGTATHVDFARRLVREEKCVQFVAPRTRVPKAKTELSRGLPDNSSGDGGKENTWDALARMAEERGWRRFVRGASQLFYVPDSYLMAGAPYYVLRPGQGGVDDIDFDVDVGKPVSTATVTARAGEWQVPVGLMVQVTDTGPGDGKWLVTEINRNLASVSVSVTLAKPQGTLPEPKPDAAAGKSTKKKVAGKTGAGGSSSSGGSAAPLAKDFVNLALSKVGDPYVWGAETGHSFDCSGLVQWVAHQLGLTAMPRVSGDQYQYCRKQGTLISISRAEHVKGALLFEGASGSQHVAISLGDGRTVEAHSRATGVGKFSASGRPWTAAALIPGVVY